MEKIFGIKITFFPSTGSENDFDDFKNKHGNTNYQNERYKNEIDAFRSEINENLTLARHKKKE